MTFTEFILFLIIAAFCGAIGQRIAGYTLGGCVVSIFVGFIGALLGKWLAGKLGLQYLLEVHIGGSPFPIVWSIIGAAVFAILVGLLTRHRAP